MQKLSIAEEEALGDWLVELSSWGQPLQIERLRVMATEMLIDKRDTHGLRVHQTNQFLNRHPQLRTKFVAGLDKEQAKAQDDPEVFRHWF